MARPGNTPGLAYMKEEKEMSKKDNAVSWAISLKASEWDFIREVAEQWGVSRSGAVAFIIRLFRWQNGGHYEEALSSYMAARVKGREDGVREE